MSDNNIRKRKLNCGSQLIHIAEQDSDLSAASVWFRAGSRYDPDDKCGLAHFFEHVYMAESEAHPNQIERLSLLDQYGIDFNARTTRELAHYYHIQPVNHLIDSLEILAEGVATNVFNENVIEKEKSIVSNEVREIKNTVHDLIRLKSEEALWPDADIGRDFFGVPEDIVDFSIDNVAAFAEEYYTPQNAVFVVIGDKDTDVIADTINAQFSDALEEGKVTQKVQRSYSSPTPLVIDHSEEDTQTMIAVSYRTPAVESLRDEVLADLVIQHILADTWTSRLIERLRIEEGLAYWVDGEWDAYSDTGFVRFVFTVDSDDVEEALRIYADEVAGLQNTTPDNLLGMHKTSLISDFLRGHQTILSRLQWYGSHFLLDQEIPSLQEYISTIQGISPEDIQTFAQKSFDPKFRTVAMAGGTSKDDARNIVESKLM